MRINIKKNGEDTKQKNNNNLLLIFYNSFCYLHYYNSKNRGTIFNFSRNNCHIDVDITMKCIFIHYNYRMKLFKFFTKKT